MNIVSCVYLSYMAMTVSLAFIVPAKWQCGSLVLMTALFLACFSPISLLILTPTSLMVFYCANKKHHRSAFAFLSIGIVGLIFALYKSANDIDAIWKPLGISYYSLRQIHYILESLKSRLETHTLSDYLAYVFFLPTLHVGPIHRFPEFLRDIGRRRWDPQNIASGLERILYGYAKIVIVGYYLIARFDHQISLYADTSPLLYAYLSYWEYWLNLYFQFSGYSDVAIGFGAIMGFRIRENFDWPFLSRNIIEFWQKWHISLTSWCRDYVYLPAASLTRNPLGSILLAMIVLGLWHEFSMRYIFWGIYHALGIAICHKFQTLTSGTSCWQNRGIKQILDILSILVTLHFVIFSMPVAHFFYQLIKL